MALTLSAKAQFTDNTSHSARNSAMGGVLLYDLDRRQVSIGYRQAFLAKGMADKTLHMVWPTGTGGVTADYLHHGNIDYHEQQVGISYALRATRWLTVGVGGRYLHLGTSDGHYRPQQWLGALLLVNADLGGHTSLSLTAGTRPWDTQRPYLLHLVAIYRPLPQLITIVEAESEEHMRMRFGTEYTYRNDYFLRTGFSTHPFVLTFGLGLRYQQCTIDLAVEAHHTLGITPHTSLTLCF